MVINGWVTALTVAFGVLVSVAVVFAYLRLYSRQKENISGSETRNRHNQPDSIEEDQKRTGD